MFLPVCMSYFVVVFLLQFVVCHCLLEQECLLVVVGCSWVVNRSRYEDICQARRGVLFLSSMQ